MRPFFVVFNDFSLKRGGNLVSDDVSLLERLWSTFRAFVNATSNSESERIQACLPAQVWMLRLPGGSTLSEALKALVNRDRELGQRLSSLISRAPRFDELGVIDGVDTQVREEVFYEDEPVLALSVVWNHAGLCWSLDRPGWQTHTVGVSVSSSASEPRGEMIHNVWCAEIRSSLRKSLSTMGLLMLPLYENPGHHDPHGSTEEQRKNYRKFKEQKSVIPRNAEQMLRYALPVEGQSGTWWALCEHGFFHRYQGGKNNEWHVLHWNGTTDEAAIGNRSSGERTRKEDVPMNLRKTLESSRDRRFRGCGCWPYAK